jgi:hypothetical protein
LLLNEYNVLSNQKSIDTYINIINLLKKRNLIDGVCEQGHYFALKYSSLTTLKNNLNKLATTDLPIQITEFDIDEADDNEQKEKMEDFFPLFWEHPDIEGITFWGYVYSETWLTDAYLLDDRMNPRPAMEWLKTYIAIPLPPVFIEPVNSTDEPLDLILKWHSSDSADAYHVQVATLSSFSNVITDTTLGDTTIQINSLSSNTKYYWRVSALNEHGESRYSDMSYFYTRDTTTAINNFNEIPSELILYQNYPNPFNPNTTIKYLLDKNTRVYLSIYNISGLKICDLVEQYQNSGIHQAIWDGRDTSGQFLPSGTYFYKLKTDNRSEIKKMLLIKSYINL